MSHEVRTPIAGIIGLGELLSETKLTPNQQEITTGVQQAANFLLSLVNNVLDFSKIESGHMHIEAVPFSARKLVSDLCGMMTFRAKEKGLDLIILNDLPEGMCVTGDPVRLGQVLTNLLSNSIKFTERGRVTLTTTVATEEGMSDCSDAQTLAHSKSCETETKVMMRIVVEDTGCGISEEAMKNLFQPFSQANASTARIYGGSGLGLSICRQLVQLMGGSIHMASQPSVGTTVTVEIPYGLCKTLPGSAMDGIPDRISQDTESRTPTPTPPGEQLSTRGSKFRKMRPVPSPVSVPLPLVPSAHDMSQDCLRDKALTSSRKSGGHILIVEDNPLNQKIAMANIRKLGFSVSAAWNGEEALAYLDSALRLDRTTPELILMDCMMPVMDGYEATQAIRNDTARYSEFIRSIPIVALTASAIQGDQERCKAIGMNDYLSKPIGREALKRTIEKWLFHRRETLSLSRHQRSS
ncbi:hypothetical protein H2203_001055 [Taxawa tesnikishii (nom. ined.)]|nr:hypothetical protein H2203_001055 [Dothideales sp. JES 119]